MNATNEEGLTPLMWLVHPRAQGNEWVPRKVDNNIVRVLLAAGAEVNVADSYYGRSPLLWAAENGDVAAVRTLLKAGANIRVVDAKEMTALDIAKSHHYAQVVALLQESMAAEQK